MTTTIGVVGKVVDADQVKRLDEMWRDHIAIVAEEDEDYLQGPLVKYYKPKEKRLMNSTGDKTCDDNVSA